MKKLPARCNLRRAYTTDAKQIQQMVWSEWLDPTGLHWSQFWVIEREGDLIACGQLRHHGDVQELSSLVVDPSWRGQGIGTHLAQHLVEQAINPLYLSCGSGLIKLYNQTGFREISWLEVPCSLKLKFGQAQLIGAIRGKDLALMQCLPRG